MTDFSSVLDSVPHYRRYMTVDELHQRSSDMVNEYPDLARALGVDWPDD